MKKLLIFMLSLCLALPMAAKKDGFKKGIHDFAYADGRVYSGNWLDFLPSGDGKMVMPNGDSYEGTWVLGHLQGDGRILRTSGDIVMGRFANGNLVGEVTIQYVNGGRYVGLVKAEKDPVVQDYIVTLVRHGHGVMTNGEGDVTTGTFENDEPIGKVRIVYADKSVFDGSIDPEGRRTGLYKKNTDGVSSVLELENDVEKGIIFELGTTTINIEVRDGKHYTKKITDKDNNTVVTYNQPYPEFTSDFTSNAIGEGKLVIDKGEFTGTLKGLHPWTGVYKNYKDDNGDILNGPVVEGKLHGECTVEYDDGDKYVGNFVNGERSGHGVYTWADGGKYEGEWANHKMNGQGTRTFADGGKFVGTFKDDETWTGESTNVTYYSDGEPFAKYTGHEENGKKSGQGTWAYTSNTQWYGDKYVGQFKNGMFNGQGTYTFSDGRKYVGGWADDKKSGQGTFTWPDGRKYVGQFKDNMYNGQGTYYYASGAKYVGGWVNDKRHGQGTYTGGPGDVVKRETGTYVNGRLRKGTLVRTNGTFVGEWDENGRKIR